MFSAINEIIYSTFNIFLNMLPVADEGLLTFATAYTSDFKSGIATLNWMFPVDTFFQAFRYMFAIEGTILFWKIVKTVIKISPAGWGSNW